MSSPPVFVRPGATPDPPPDDGRPVVVLASGRQRIAARRVALALTIPLAALATVLTFMLIT